MKRFERIIAAAMLCMICSANAVFAVPVKVDDDNPRQTASATQKPKATEIAKATVKPSEKATEKPSSTTKATESPKPTEKPSAKPSATPKSTDKATDASDDKIVLDAEDDAIVLEATTEPMLNIQSGSEQFENKKYLTKFGAFLWFLFTVIVSAVISFAISYRFYMMGKKDNHLAAEIRALKRDIDSKMVGTVGGFSEYDISVTNNNKSYAKPETSIRSAEITSGASEVDSEIYKKWESKLGSVSSPAVDERIRSSQTQNRPSQSVRRRPVKSNKTVGGKIRNAISEIFPFDKK